MTDLANAPAARPQQVRTLLRKSESGNGGAASLLHVAREGLSATQDGRQSLCGQWAARPVLRLAPHPLPGGLTWCTECLVRFARQTGRTGDVARALGLEEEP